MNRRLLLALTVAASLLSACGPKSKLDLDLRSVSITVPRIITPAIELVPQAPIAIELPPIPPVASLLPGPAAPVKKPACGAADPFDAPALALRQEIAGPPAEDTFTQLALGAYGADGKVETLAGAVTTTIKRLPSATNSTGQKIDAWTVQRVDTANKATSVEVYQFVHPFPSPAATASGIYLVGLAWDDPARGKLSFQPVGNGLVIAPNPVVIAQNGVQYVGVATDPSSLTTVALVRNVTGRKRVDLCGALVDTFTVAMTGTITSPDAQYQLSWTQQFATAYGASDVEHTLALNSPRDGFSWTRYVRNVAVPKELP